MSSSEDLKVFVHLITLSEYDVYIKVAVNIYLLLNFFTQRSINSPTCFDDVIIYKNTRTKYKNTDFGKETYFTIKYRVLSIIREKNRHLEFFHRKFVHGPRSVSLKSTKYVISPSLSLN